MADVGSFFLGAIAVGAGFAAALIPVAGPLLSTALWTFGAGQLAKGIFGTDRPSHQGIQNNTASPEATIPIVYGGPVKVGVKIHETW